MKKKKIYQLRVLGDAVSKNTRDDDFYTTDTDTWLEFSLVDKKLIPEAMSISLVNGDDGSVVNEVVTLTETETILFRLDPEIIVHAGTWQGQLVFEASGEMYTSSCFYFGILSNIMDNKVPQLIKIANINHVNKMLDELIQKGDEFEDLVASARAQIDANILTAALEDKYASLESEYAPRLTDLEQNDSVLATQLAKKPSFDDLGLANFRNGSKKYKMIAGTVRNDGTGWKFVVDANHQTDLNCVSVTADSTFVHINYSAIKATKITSFLVAPDETFAQSGYFCGASVGIGQASVKLYEMIPNAVGGLATCTTYGFTLNSYNVGITGLVWDAATSKLIINHKSLGSWYSHSAAPILTPYDKGAFIPKITLINPSYIEVEFYNFDGTKITTLSDKLSFTFNRTSAEKNTTKLIDPTTIANASANLWFVGVFEVS